jgi:saccharopine dehydrogenase-like NADP-dependent oxidoreductase
MRKSVLLVGATGNFGWRLLRNLARIEGLRIFAASRDLERAKTLVASIAPDVSGCSIEPVAFSRDQDADAQLSELKPWLVIDASGPFQGADYAFAKSVLNAGAHYLDLADATDFLKGFEATVDGLAKSQGLVARTGASSTPSLSFAVVEELTRNWTRVDTIDIAIVLMVLATWVRVQRAAC